MLVAARFDFGRRLRCGDDDHSGRISTDLHGRDVWIVGIRLLFDLSPARDGNRQKPRYAGRSDWHTLQNDDDEQDHAVGRHGDHRRYAVLSTNSLRPLRIGQPLHSGHATVGVPDRGHDVTYMSAEG